MYKNINKEDHCLSVKKNKYLRNKLAYCEVEDSTGDWLITLPDLGVVWRLNQSASFVWQQLKQPETCREIVVKMRKAFFVDQQVAETDVKRMIDYGVKEGFVVEV